MKIERIELHQIAIPLVRPFQSSADRQIVRPCLLVALYSEGLVGWGECVAMERPSYSAETVSSASTILFEQIFPMLKGQTLNSQHDIGRYLSKIRGNPMARAAVEVAVWDWFAQAEGVRLYKLLGGVRERVPVGVSLGIEPSAELLAERVAQFVAEGYRRIKIKIAPDWSIEPISYLRRQFPDLMLMADANSAFTLSDTPLLQALDDFDLAMIEQPLGYDDFIEHAQLQTKLKTALCLDESIESSADMQTAVALRSCRVVNLKVGRVGGIAAAIEIHNMAQKAGWGVWCGGMLESGIGRATNIHLATLPHFTLPGDISATSRYYAEDIADPPFELNIEDSTLSVPTGVGLGVQIRLDRLRKFCVSLRTI